MKIILIGYICLTLNFFKRQNHFQKVLYFFRTGVKGGIGSDGDPGQEGFIGLTGEKGLPSPTGGQGDKGDNGDFGLVGRPGRPGFNGEKGLFNRFLRERVVSVFLFCLLY